MTKNPISELEVKVAFLEDSLSKLSDEFYLQQRELDDLKSKYAGLMTKLQSNQSGGEQADILDERPPHY